MERIRASSRRRSTASTSASISKGKTEKSARDTFFYYTGATPSAVRYKNWKIYFTMEGSTGASALAGPQTYGWAQVQNIKRDPFEPSGAKSRIGRVSRSAVPSPPRAPRTLRLEHAARRPEPAAQRSLATCIRRSRHSRTPSS